MANMLVSSVQLARRNINYYYVYTIHRAYSLSYEAAERIKGQFIQSQVRLITPENNQPTTTYKGIVMMAAGPFAKFTSLQRYSDPYLQQGFAAVNILHSKINFPSCTSCDRKVDRIFDVLSSEITDSCPIVLKFYCTGSMSFLPPILRRVSQPNCKLQISGIIFDSAPVFYNWTMASNVYRMFNDMSKHLNEFQKIRGTLFAGTFIVASQKTKGCYFERFVFDPNSILRTIPQLYIYSPEDYIAVLPYVEKVINRQKIYGADVTAKMFPDTYHMAHRKKYPEEYDKTVLKFLNDKCLSYNV